ncbi:hypothetical protein D9M73_202820 [compost metagenome]
MPGTGQQPRRAAATRAAGRWAQPLHAREVTDVTERPFQRRTALPARTGERLCQGQPTTRAVAWQRCQRPRCRTPDGSLCVPDRQATAEAGRRLARADPSHAAVAVAELPAADAQRDDHQVQPGEAIPQPVTAHPKGVAAVLETGRRRGLRVPHLYSGQHSSV